MTTLKELTRNISNVRTQHHYVQDKKTLKWYNPSEQFNFLLQKPEVAAVMNRIKNR